MKYGITTNITLQVRKGPDQRDEMVNQLLFGEVYSILETIGAWCRIESGIDQHSGWIETNCLHPISEKDYIKYLSDRQYVLKSLTKAFYTKHGKSGFWILPGSTLPEYNTENRHFNIGDEELFLEESNEEEPQPDIRQAILDTAHSYLHSPHLWGGRSLFGIDCSGFTQIVYKINGKRIPRETSQQVKQGNLVPFLEESKPGDLAFFDNDKGVICHAGILISKNKVIHASCKVRIDLIDHQGIHRSDMNEYTHKLRVIKSIL